MGTLENIKPSQINTLDEALHVAALCNVVDYLHFEGAHALRAREREQFIAGIKYVPEFDYPYLLNLEKIEITENLILRCLAIINDNLHNLSWDIAELYLGTLILNLKRAQLVTAAAEMDAAEVGSPWRETAMERFEELNRELYGDINQRVFFGIMKTELEAINNFHPKNVLSREIVAYLQESLRFIHPGHIEEKVMSIDIVAMYQQKIRRMYGNILNVVPPNQNFDAAQCAHLMNLALEAGGLGEHGWKAVVDSKKTSPSTRGPSKRIYLPADTKRTSSQLQGLILHEQEVHARRYFNGARFANMPLLANGTAEYLDVEEGLGTIMALFAAPSETSPVDRARERYIHVGLALGADGQPRDARQVFEITWRLHLLRTHAVGSELKKASIDTAKHAVYPHIENIFRGTDCFTPGVVYRKAKLYYEGLLKTNNHLRKIHGNEGAFVRMFLGKYNHTDATETARIMRIIKSE